MCTNAYAMYELGVLPQSSQVSVTPKTHITGPVLVVLELSLHQNSKIVSGVIETYEPCRTTSKFVHSVRVDAHHS